MFVGLMGCASGVCLAQAVIEGTVALPKTSAAPVMTKRYEIVTKGGMLATKPPLAVVYLEGAFPRKAPTATKQMSQKDLTFLHVLCPCKPVRAFLSESRRYLSQHLSFSPTKRFDLGRYRSDERPIPSVVFDKAGLVTVRCDIHEHMRALILVLDTPYFVMTESDGRYRLSDLPAGHHTLKAWLNSKTTLQKPVELAKGATLHVDLP